MSDALIIALVAALSGGAAAAIITGAFQRPKTRAEAAKLIAESGETLDSRWKQWAEKLETRVTELEGRLTTADAEVADLRQAVNKEKWVTRLVIAWALVLRDEIRRLGGVVVDPPIEVAEYIDGLEEPSEA